MEDVMKWPSAVYGVTDLCSQPKREEYRCLVIYSFIYIYICVCVCVCVCVWVCVCVVGQQSFI